MPSDDDASFSRTNRNGEPLAEVRALAPVKVLNVFDAMAMSETKAGGVFVSRTEVIVRHLSKIAQDEIDRANLIINLSNQQSDSVGVNHD